MKSAVAGVLDGYGGLRVVVTERWRMRNHVRAGELLLVVPGFKVREPVPWDDIPAMIEKVEDHVAWWIATRNDPDLHEAAKLYRLRRLRNFNTGSVNLCDIVET